MHILRLTMVIKGIHEHLSLTKALLVRNFLKRRRFSDTETDGKLWNEFNYISS